MSSKLHGLVWEACAFKGLITSEIAVMARLADFSNDEGISWPAVATIQRQIGAKSENTVRSAIKKLKSKGWLKKQERRVGGKNNSNVYKLNVDMLERAAAEAKIFYSPPKEQSKFEASEIEGSKFEGSKSEASNNGSASPQILRGDPSMVEGDPSLDPSLDPSSKKPSRPVAAQPDGGNQSADFISRHPEAVVYNADKRQWGSRDDLTCAEFIWGKIIGMYELAAESDGEVVRPKEPNWTAWANEIRLMVSQDSRTHKQICSLFKRANKDSFWCKNILSPSKLREKWDELSIKLSSSLGNSRTESTVSRASFDGVDYSLPENSGFRS